MTERHLQTAKNLLVTSRYITLATSSRSGQPWNSPLGFIYDHELNFYWASDQHNQHSRNVRENEKVFIVIYDSTATHDGDGLYVEALAQELEDLDSIQVGLSSRKTPNGDKPEDFLGQSNRRLYRAQPVRVWINDAEEKDGVFVRDYRVEIDLFSLRQQIPS